MTLHKLSILIVFLGCSILSFGQSSKQNKADELVNKLQYVEAIKVYKELIANDYNVSENRKQLADIYNELNDPENAVKYYEYVVQQDSISPEYYFRYAQNLRGVKRYGESVKWLRRYREAGQSSTAVDAIISSDSIPAYTALSYENFQPVTYNSEYSDFGVFVRSGVTYFTTARLEDKSTNSTLYGLNEEPFLDVYTAYKSRDNADFLLKSKIKPLKGEVNSKLHDGPVSITGDGKHMYFTRNNLLGTKEAEDDIDTNRLKIYRATKKGDQWEGIEELPFNSDDYSTGAPSVTKDGKTLYFASDRPGTYGGTDIYKVNINDDGSFSEPINLGEKINTERDELFPQYYADDKLFFASEGHKGYGLLDNFVALKDDSDTFSQVVNLGPIINSSLDDFSFFLVDGQTEGYVASNREGGLGSDDIYHFDLKADVIDCTIVLSGQVTDAVNNRPIPGTTITLFDSEGKQIAFLTTDENGNYETTVVNCDNEYPVEVRKISYESLDDNIYTYVDKKEGENQITKNFRLAPIEDVEILAQLEIIYFDFDKYNIRPDAAVELDKLANLMQNVYPQMVIKIGSHTDKRGSFAYNDRLAVNRATSTFDYLVEKGVDSDRILAYKGFGENQPAIRCPNNDCNETEHQLNRRSVFEVVKMK